MKKITALAMVLILAFSMAITVSADDTMIHLLPVWH